MESSGAVPCDQATTPPRPNGIELWKCYRGCDRRLTTKWPSAWWWINLTRKSYWLNYISYINHANMPIEPGKTRLCKHGDGTSLKHATKSGIRGFKKSLNVAHIRDGSIKLYSIKMGLKPTNMVTSRTWRLLWLMDGSRVIFGLNLWGFERIQERGIDTAQSGWLPELRVHFSGTPENVWNDSWAIHVNRMSLIFFDPYNLGVNHWSNLASQNRSLQGMRVSF